MNAPAFLVVGEHVARNPVARAIARRRVAEAMRDFQTRLYLLTEGEDVRTDCSAAAKVMAVAAATLDHLGQGVTAEARVIAGGLGAVADISRTGWQWRQRHAVAIDQALERARAVFATAPASAVQAGHRTIDAMEERAS